MRWIAIPLLAWMLCGCAAQHARDDCCCNLDKAIAPNAQTLIKTGRTLDAIDQAEQVSIRNLANLETTGYKRYVAQVDEEGSLSAYVDFEQGGPRSTGRQLDVAISGSGFFRAVTTDERKLVMYTRVGNLFANHEGELIVGLGDSYRLEPSIALPADTKEVRISANGIVQVTRADSTTMEAIGKIRLYTFVNPKGMQLQGPCMFGATAESGEAIESMPGESGSGTLLQSFLEDSNVSRNKEEIRLAELCRWRKTLRQSIGLP